MSVSRRDAEKRKRGSRDYIINAIVFVPQSTPAWPLGHCLAAQSICTERATLKGAVRRREKNEADASFIPFADLSRTISSTVRSL